MTVEDVGEIRLRDVQRLRLGPDETLVVSLPNGVSPEGAKACHEMLKGWFPDNQVMLLSDGVTLFVIQPTPKGGSTGQDRIAEEA